ncbi:MAG: hypothetical protein WC335_09710, partial [Candidatus Omnitrophota bacterium]
MLRLRKKSAEFRAKEKEFRLSEDHLKRSGDPGKRVSVSVQGIKNMPAGKVTQEDIKEAMRENGFRTNEALRHLCSNGKGQSGYDEKFAGDYNKNRLTAEEVVSALKKSDCNPHKGCELLRSNGKRITYDAFYAWVKKLTNPNGKYYDPLLTQKYNEWKKNSRRNECPASVSSGKSRKRPARVHEDGDGKTMDSFMKELDEKINMQVRMRAFGSALSHLDSLRSVHSGIAPIQAVIDDKERRIWEAMWDAADVGLTAEYLIKLSYLLPYGIKELFQKLRPGILVQHPLAGLFAGYHIPATLDNLKVMLDCFSGNTGSDLKGELAELQRIMREVAAEGSFRGFVEAGELSFRKENPSFQRVLEGMGVTGARNNRKNDGGDIYLVRSSRKLRTCLKGLGVGYSTKGNMYIVNQEELLSQLNSGKFEYIDRIVTEVPPTKAEELSDKGYTVVKGTRKARVFDQEKLFRLSGEDSEFYGFWLPLFRQALSAQRGDLAYLNERLGIKLFHFLRVKFTEEMRRIIEKDTAWDEFIRRLSYVREYLPGVNNTLDLHNLAGYLLAFERYVNGKGIVDFEAVLLAEKTWSGLPLERTSAGITITVFKNGSKVTRRFPKDAKNPGRDGGEKVFPLIFSNSRFWERRFTYRAGKLASGQLDMPASRSNPGIEQKFLFAISLLPNAPPDCAIYVTPGIRTLPFRDSGTSTTYLSRTYDQHSTSNIELHEALFDLKQLAVLTGISGKNKEMRLFDFSITVLFYSLLALFGDRGPHNEFFRAVRSNKSFLKSFLTGAEKSMTRQTSVSVGSSIPPAHLPDLFPDVFALFSSKELSDLVGDTWSKLPAWGFRRVSFDGIMNAVLINYLEKSGCCRLNEKDRNRLIAENNPHLAAVNIAYLFSKQGTGLLQKFPFPLVWSMLDISEMCRIREAFGFNPLSPDRKIRMTDDEGAFRSWFAGCYCNIKKAGTLLSRLAADESGSERDLYLQRLRKMREIMGVSSFENMLNILEKEGGAAAVQNYRGYSREQDGGEADLEAEAIHVVDLMLQGSFTPESYFVDRWLPTGWVVPTLIESNSKPLFVDYISNSNEYRRLLERAVTSALERDVRHCARIMWLKGLYGVEGCILRLRKNGEKGLSLAGRILYDNPHLGDAFLEGIKYGQLPLTEDPRVTVDFVMDLVSRGKDVSVVWDIGVDCLTPWGGYCALDMAESINRNLPIPVTGFYLKPGSLKKLPKADNLEFEMLTTQKPLTPRI